MGLLKVLLLLKSLNEYWDPLQFYFKIIIYVLDLLKQPTGKV